MSEMSIAYIPENGNPATLVSIRCSMSYGFMCTISNVDWTHKVDYSHTDKLTAKDVMQEIREFVYARQRGRVNTIKSRIVIPSLTLSFLRTRFTDEHGHKRFSDALEWDKFVYEDWAKSARSRKDWRPQW